MEKRHIRRENKVKQVLTEKHVLSRVAHEFVVKLWFTFQVRASTHPYYTRLPLQRPPPLPCALFCSNTDSRGMQDAESLYLVLDLATGGELHTVIQHYKERALAAGLGPQVDSINCL